MDGLPPPANNSPSRKSQDLLTPTSTPSGGVQQSTGQRYTPDLSSPIPHTPIGSRAASVQQGVRPQLNTYGQIQQLSDQYLEHHAQATAITNELNLANSAPTIRNLLENPEKALKTSSFMILWVPDDGSDPVRVIPPGDKMQQQKELAAELRKTLDEQLTKLESIYIPSKIQNLQGQQKREVILRDHAASELIKMGGSLPPAPTPNNVSIFGASRINTPIAPPVKVTPETGQPKPVPSPHSQPTTVPDPTPARHNGKFMLQMQPPKLPEAPASLQHPTFTPPARVGLEDEFDDGKQSGLLTGRPSIIPDLKSYQPLTSGQDDSFPPLPPEGMLRPHKDPWTVAKRQEVTETPSLVPSLANVSYSVLGPGGDGIHTDLYRHQNDTPRSNLASVNAGNSTLKFGDTGINGAFKKQVTLPDDPSGIEALHHEMWNAFPTGYINAATPDQLKSVKGIKASVIYKPDAARGHTGTVIIDVFEPPYPNGNPNNKAMIYVVQPDGRSGMSAEEFKKEVAITAEDVVQTLHTYNTYARKEDLPVIPELRMCGFSSGQHLHTFVTKAEVGQCIEKGVRDALEYIQKTEPSTVHKVEFADGKGEVFAQQSKPLSDETLLDPFGVTPFVTPPPTSSAPLQSGSKKSVDNLFGMDAPFDGTQPFSSSSTGQIQEQDPTWANFGSIATPQASPSFPNPGQPQYNTPQPQIQTTPPFATPNPPTMLTAHLQNSPVPLAENVEANKNTYANQALNQVRGTAPLPDKLILKPGFNSRLHTVRKAQMARVLLNYHRAHCHGQVGKEAAHIPPQAIPLVEMGVLYSKSSRVELLEGKGSVNNAQDAKQRLQQLPMNPDLARAVAESVNGVSNKGNVLSVVMRDVERMESMRTAETFDITSLESFGMYDDSAKEELINLCIEYKDVLNAQGDLIGAESTANPEQKFTSKRERDKRSKTSIPTLTLVAGKQFIGEYTGSSVQKVHDLKATTHEATIHEVSAEDRRNALENSMSVYDDSLKELRKHLHLHNWFNAL